MALEDCKRVMTPGEVANGCLIISAYQYPNSCNTYTAAVYNKTGDLLDTRLMGSFGDSGRCNITFNYTTIGSYLMNFTSGDSATVIVEGDDTMFIGISLIMIGVTLLFAFIAIKASHLGVQVGFSLLSIMMVVFDFFMAARITEAVDPTQLAIISNLDTFYQIALKVQWVAIWAAMVFIIVALAKVIVNFDKKKKQAREELYLYGK